MYKQGAMEIQMQFVLIVVAVLVALIITAFSDHCFRCVSGAKLNYANNSLVSCALSSRALLSMGYRAVSLTVGGRRDTAGFI
jgi:hypothetical protein